MPRPPDSDGASGDGIRHAAAAIGVAVLALPCCAGPALLAAGTIGAIGAWLCNPWVIVSAIALAAVAVAGMLRRTRSGRKRDCCEPAADDAQATPPTTTPEPDR